MVIEATAAAKVVAQAVQAVLVAQAAAAAVVKAAAVAAQVPVQATARMEIKVAVVKVRKVEMTADLQRPASHIDMCELWKPNPIFRQFLNSIKKYFHFITGKNRIVSRSGSFFIIINN